MKLIRSASALAVTAAVLALTACGGGKSDKAAAPAAPVVASVPASETVATVNGVAIGKSRVDMIVKQAAGQGQPDTPEARQSILDQMTMQMVLAEEAMKKGLDKAPEVVDRMEMVRQSVLANAWVQDALKGSLVSDEAMKAEYERIKAAAVGTEYKARHILVEKEADAKAIIAKLKKDPAAFNQVAKTKSLDPGSKEKGGDLGWFDARRMVPEFGAALAKLEKGKMTDEPVKTQFGYHVIVLDDSKPIEPPPFEEVKPALSQEMGQKALKKQMDDLKAKAKIEIVGAAPASGAASGAKATGAVEPAPAATPAAAASAAPAAAASSGK